MINEKLVKHLAKKNNNAYSEPASKFEVSIYETLDFSLPEGTITTKSDWLVEITELENYFQKSEYPKWPIKINQCCTILDINKFTTSHISVLKANNGNSTFLPFLERLRELKFYFQK